jgi:predicted SAM-dependent methyltransferase
MKLNIGSGGTKIEGFVTCDYDPLAEPDYCFNLETDTFPFEDNSVETVVAHHVLEHLGEGYFHCLKELYRVCKHGAIIDIRVPHHRHDTFHNDPTHRRPITVDGLILFSKKYNKICKQQQAASSRLGDYFDVDFEIANFEYIPSQEYAAEFEGRPKEEVEKYLSQHNNIILEVWIQLVVVKDE